MERSRPSGHRLVEQVLLRLDVRVERALLDAERLGDLADRGAVVALLARTGARPGGSAPRAGRSSAPVDLGRRAVEAARAGRRPRSVAAISSISPTQRQPFASAERCRARVALGQLRLREAPLLEQRVLDALGAARARGSRAASRPCPSSRRRRPSSPPTRSATTRASSARAREQLRDGAGLARRRGRAASCRPRAAASRRCRRRRSAASTPRPRRPRARSPARPRSRPRRDRRSGRPIARPPAPRAAGRSRR